MDERIEMREKHQMCDIWNDDICNDICYSDICYSDICYSYICNGDIWNTVSLRLDNLKFSS